MGGLPERVVIGSVVPSVDAVLLKAIKKSFGCAPLRITAGSPLGLKLKVRAPDRLGVDRLLNALALRELFSGPAIAIDFGTATTFDCVDAKGAYIGGAILLGPNSAARALHEFTEKLPLIAVRKPKTIIGKDTKHCLEAGLYYGYLGMIREVLSGMKLELGGAVAVVATGGLAPLFLKDLPGVRHEPNLTLNGLRLASDIISEVSVEAGPRDNA